MTTREDALNALAALMDASAFFPSARIDEPEPTGWETVFPDDGGVRLTHAVAVQDGPPPERLAFARGGVEGEALDELELEAAIAYAVRAAPLAGATAAEVRRARRSRRDQAATVIAGIIAGNRTLGLGDEVWAEVLPAQRDDEVAFANALPSATIVVPIRILYTAAHAAG